MEEALDSIGKFFSQSKGEDGDGSKLFNWSKWGVRSGCFRLAALVCCVLVVLYRDVQCDGGVRYGAVR